MSVDSISIKDILVPNKAYSTKEVASLVNQNVTSVRQKLQRLVDTNVLIKRKAKNITYWALNPANFEN